MMATPEAEMELIDPPFPSALPFKPTSSNVGWKISKETRQLVLVLEIPEGVINGHLLERKRVFLPWDGKSHVRRDDVRVLHFETKQTLTILLSNAPLANLHTLSVSVVPALEDQGA
jgi:hypothetical protein